MRFSSCSFHASSAALSPQNAGRLTTTEGHGAWLGPLAVSNSNDSVMQSFPYLMLKLQPMPRFHHFPNCSLDTTEKKAKEKITQQCGGLLCNVTSSIHTKVLSVTSPQLGPSHPSEMWHLQDRVSPEKKRCS